MKKIIFAFSLLLLLTVSFTSIEIVQAKSVPNLGKIVYLKSDKHVTHFSQQKIACKAGTICFSIANYTKHWIQLKWVYVKDGSSSFWCSLNPSKILSTNTVCRANYGTEPNALGTWLYYDVTDPKAKPLVVTVT